MKMDNRIKSPTRIHHFKIQGSALLSDYSYSDPNFPGMSITPIYDRVAHQVQS